MSLFCKENDRRLHRKSSRVSIENAETIVKALRLAIQSVTWGHCVGMAAPQIGINRRVFIALDEVYINPTIKKRSEATYAALEGCYSLTPHAAHRVTRHASIEIEYQDIAGLWRVEKLMGFRAQVVQHEYDHIEGILISTKEKNYNGI